MNLMKHKAGQVGNLAGIFIGLMIAAIVGIGVTVPIITQVITNASLTGMTGTIAGYIPMMIVLVLFIAVAGVAVVGFVRNR